MKINFLRESIFVALAAALLVACGGRNNMSRATGWGINSKDGGFQYNIEFEDQESGPGLVFIEGGTYTKGQVQDDVLHDWNNTPTQQHVMSFYIESNIKNISDVTASRIYEVMTGRPTLGKTEQNKIRVIT